jgi:FkbM family methyltransferase
METRIVPVSWLSYRYDLEVFCGDHIGDHVAKNNRPYEHKELLFIKYLRLKGTYLDLGANIGNHTIPMSRMGATKIIAVEMVPSTMEVLGRNVGRSASCPVELIMEPVGAGGEMSVVEYAGNAGKNRLVEKGGEKDMVAKSRGCATVTGQINTRRLDDLVRDRDVVFIKMDVEGSEPDVIAGGMGVFSSGPVVVTESFSEKKAQDLAGLLGFELRKLRYHSYAIFPEDHRERVERAAAAAWR